MKGNPTSSKYLMYCQKLACSPLALSSQFKRRTIKEIRLLAGSLPCSPGHMPATSTSVILSRIVFVVTRQVTSGSCLSICNSAYQWGFISLPPLLGHHEHC